MSTLPKPSPLREPPPADEKRQAEVVPVFDAFPYDILSFSDLRQQAIVLAANSMPDDISSTHAGANEAAIRKAQARAQGREEGQAAAHKVFEEHLAQARTALAEALAGFTRDRAAYFEKIEGEVVQLALAIARKILHREAQIDPLLLAGIVRVALEKIEGATGVRLRVHPQNAADWRRYLTTHLDPHDLPEIVEDAAQPLDRCVLETSMGTATIGLEVQLKEVEQGLMDLLAARPEVRAGVSS